MVFSIVSYFYIAVIYHIYKLNALSENMAVRCYMLLLPNDAMIWLWKFWSPLLMTQFGQYPWTLSESHGGTEGIQHFRCSGWQLQNNHLQVEDVFVILVQKSRTDMPVVLLELSISSDFSTFRMTDDKMCACCFDWCYVFLPGLALVIVALHWKLDVSWFIIWLSQH